MSDARLPGAASTEPVRLDRAEALNLLAKVQVGRLIFTVNALPAVRLMNFALCGEQIVMRTAEGTTAARKIHGSIVAFEADGLDPSSSSGWSVTVTGRATLVVSADAIARYSSLALQPWAAGERDRFVTITTEVIEGQRVGPRDRWS